MHNEQAEDAEGLIENNRRLQALVGDLLRKNEALRQQLALLQQPAGHAAQQAQAS